MFVVVFFKQKTAYEMRISDWSSDVCSSDLGQPGRRDGDAGGRGRGRLARRLTAPADGAERCRRRGGGALPRLLPEDRLRSRSARRCRFGDLRSEEHTSELQSLMRISYAVFCLKKKKHH